MKEGKKEEKNADKMQNKKKSRYRTSLRIYITFVFIMILCFSCLFSFGIVILCSKLIYKGAFTLEVAVWMSFFVCLLTMILGGMLMFAGSFHLTKPLRIVTSAVQKVAEGDFSVRIFRKKEYRRNHLYTNEIDELSENFNQMASELDGMQVMRKDFMSNVSHELKTPIFAIAGISELLMEDKLDKDEKKEYLNLMHEEAQRLSRLCDNMLQLSRLDNQRILPQKEKVRVDEQIRQCVILLTEKWQEKEFEFQLELPEAIVFANKDLLMQIWINLLDNAMKYTKDNTKIAISERIENSELFVSIEDHGIGIAKEKQNKIFEQFYQCEESHKKNGNGLGLSIVKRIVEIYNGNIRCESILNEGTKMIVKLPVY